MDFNPFQDNACFVDLLNSQQHVVLGSQEEPIHCDEPPAERRERRSWSPVEDIVLISSWLNTSKDPVVGNEQKSEAFWKRIASYYSASPKLSGCEKRSGTQCKQRWHKLNDLFCKFCGAFEAATRERSSGKSSWLNTSKDPVVGNEQKSEAFWKRIASYYSASPKLSGCEKRSGTQCKQRWHKLNDLVCKFCGAFKAATRERSSGMNDTDVLKLADGIFFNNHQKKFTLEHAWKELRADEKWCELSTAKTVSSSKRRKLEGGSHTGSSQVKGNNAGVDDDVTCRPAGVKAAKARGKKPLVEDKEIYDFKTIWEMNAREVTGWLFNLQVTMALSLCQVMSLYMSRVLCLCMSRVVWLSMSRVCFDTPTYPKNFFRRRFRINKPLFMKIVHRLSTEVEFFRQKQDALGRSSLSPLQKCTAAIRVLAYGSAADAVDEYLRLGETTTRSCVEHFVEGIIYLFGDEYLRRPTSAYLQRLLDIGERLLDIGERRGFPGMIGSIDCMHWEWKNCPTAWKGQYSRGSSKQTIVLEAVASYDLWIWHAFFGPPGTLNDINVLDRSPVFDDIINGQAPQVTYSVNGREYRMAYYLTDGIYLKWTTFIQSISLPQDPKAVLFAQRQEAARKDVERAFGVLQARFAIVKSPALFWDKPR
uniref:Myb-like domain-containing protein n=1 Tax=Brassica oleracea var. oleracea TaxID=109376 RepID=A0A0D3DK18_BRAOL